MTTRKQFNLGRLVYALSEEVELRRHPSSAYDEHGRFVELDPEVSYIDAAVQPAAQKDLVQVPEGRKLKGGIKIFSTEQLFTASVEDRRQPDKIVWQGDEYEIVTVNEWNKDGNYYRSLALRVGQ
jgi:hypothetical protein